VHADTGSHAHESQWACRLCCCFDGVLQVPETLQYRVVRNMSRNDLTVVDSIVEAPGILQAKPKLTGELQQHAQAQARLRSRLP
jgi:hypothetical protein